jgi:hypothetical protein
MVFGFQNCEKVKFKKDAASSLAPHISISGPNKIKEGERFIATLDLEYADVNYNHWTWRLKSTDPNVEEFSDFDVTSGELDFSKGLSIPFQIETLNDSNSEDEKSFILEFISKDEQTTIQRPLFLSDDDIVNDTTTSTQSCYKQASFGAQVLSETVNWRGVNIHSEFYDEAKKITVIFWVEGNYGSATDEFALEYKFTLNGTDFSSHKGTIKAPSENVEFGYLAVFDKVNPTSHVNQMELVSIVPAISQGLQFNAESVTLRSESVCEK